MRGRRSFSHAEGGTQNVLGVVLTLELEGLAIEKGEGQCKRFPPFKRGGGGGGGFRPAIFPFSRPPHPLPVITDWSILVINLQCQFNRSVYDDSLRAGCQIIVSALRLTAPHFFRVHTRMGRCMPMGSGVPLWPCWCPKLPMPGPTPNLRQQGSRETGKPGELGKPGK